MRRRGCTAASIDPSAAALEAGQNAAFSAAALVGVLALGASLYNGMAPTQSEAPPVAPPASGDVSAADIDLAIIEDAVFVPETDWDVSATPVVFNVPASMLQPLAPLAPAPMPAVDPAIASEVSFRDDALRLTLPNLFARAEQEPTLDSGARAHAPASMSDRLDEMAADLTYEAPKADSHDVAVFVAADDEAVSWTLNQSSPNYGNVAYEEDRVEVGDLSAGVALTTDDMRIAAAYVERDMDMRLGRGFENHDQRYAGVIVTFKN
jgi:hypothetical protein